jgi:glycogen debranching enzyme
MASFAGRLQQPAGEYRALAERVAAGFERFWYAPGGYCHDVLDTPAGDDATLRPNQILAVSLPDNPLLPERQRAVVDVVASRLLTSYGLRSLAPDHPQYRGRYGGDQRARDGAYHQGTVWAWRLGPFALAHFRVYRDAAAARSFLLPLADHLGDYGVGSIAEIFDGEPPFRPGGCVAQAWSVSETLRAWHALSRA